MKFFDRLKKISMRSTVEECVTRLVELFEPFEKSGQGLKNVDLLKKLRRTIRWVPHVNTGAGMLSKEKLWPSSDGHHCLLATCFKRGAISGELADKLQWVAEFSQHFGCTRQEADEIIYGTPRHETGWSYARAITKLLRKYGY